MAGFDYDLFVIGGGSGGVRAARLAASMGRKVAIAEEYRYGGTCVIRGCVPKKLLVYASQFSQYFKDAPGFGWQAVDGKFNWSKLISDKDAEIARLEGIYRDGLGRAKAEIFDSRAVVEGENLVRIVNENRTVSAEKILIAVGGTPSRLPQLPGQELCITSDDVFDLNALPKSIVIFGGGYIAVEFAGIFAGLGTQTTLVYRGEKILRGFDRDLRTTLQEAMTNRGIEVICESNPDAIERLEDGRLSVALDGGQTLIVDQAMLAVGRKPLSEGLGLEKAGVATSATGHIPVDEYSATNAKSIWAVGDVTDRVPLTPVAIHESMCFIQTEFKNNPTKPDHHLVPTAVFSQPEIGTVGMSEEMAASQHKNLSVFLAKFRPMKHSLTGSDENMLMKIVVNEDDDQVLGAHILGEGAGELAQLLGIALKSGATKKDFDNTMAVHPTATEELVTMYEPSYRIVDGQHVR